jgi:nitrogen fixation NifU-like protein
MINIYQEIILDHFKNPKNFGLLNTPTSTVKVANPLCGDEIEMGVVIEEKKIKEIKFRGVGCAISKAAASMLTEYVKGKMKDKLQKLDREFMIKLLGVELGPNRIKCALLPLEALQKLI